MSELKPANQHPDFGKVCIHGSLKRKCYTCELEDDVEKYKSLCRELLDFIQNRGYFNNGCGCCAESSIERESQGLLEKVEKELK
jgi:hypothetical protein